MINLADKLTAKTVEGILADSKEIKYTKEMGDTAKAETVAKELSNMTDSITELSQEVSELKKGGGYEISGTIETLSGNVETLSGNVMTLSGNVETLSGNVMTLSGNVETLPGNVMTLSGNVETLSGNVMTLSGNVITQGEKLSELEEEIDASSQEVSELTNDVDELSGKVETLSGEVVTQGEKLSELESQVIYDVTANNSGTTFDSLSALLSNENLSTLIPSEVRCGGMSIRFIQSSDNKYVQYRYMGIATTGTSNPFLDTDNWTSGDGEFLTGEKVSEVGIDDVPTAGSDNLVKSGGVASKLSKITDSMVELSGNVVYHEAATETVKDIDDTFLEIFSQNESARQTNYELKEAARDSEFASKEAQRDEATAIIQQEVETLNTLSGSVINLSQELSKRIQGKSDESSAYTDPFIKIGDFTEWAELSEALDGLSTQKYMGRCRATVSGSTVEVYQFTNNFGNDDYTQVVLGNVSVGDNGLELTYNNFNILHRQNNDGAWSVWQRINDHPLATPSMDGLMSAADKTSLDAAKADITSMQSSKADKTDLDTVKGEISENARLIESLESSLESTDEKADTAMRILTFASTVENVNIEEQIISSDFSILYDIGKGCFVAFKDGKYYSSFLGSENYNSIFGGVLKAREDRLFLSLDDNFIYHYDGTKLIYFAITDDERTKLLAYPANPLDISTATTSEPGLMSAADKTKLDHTKPVEEVTWTKDHHMSGYTECGEFHIKGQRLNKYDGMPILNANPGHTIDATLTVLDSSLSAGTGAKTDTCVTQILRISNRTGGDGHVYVRTGQGVDKEQLAWGTWEKLMGMFEKNTVDTIEDLDGYTTNGMYSGLYAANTATHGGVQFSPGDTFLIVTVNGYAVGLLGNNQLNPQITQLLYKLPAKTLESEQNAEIYLRTGSYNKTDKVWVWGNFTKMVTNSDLASQVANLTGMINQNSANITSATTTAYEARTIAQEAQSAATSAATAAIAAQKDADTATRMLRFSNIVYDANIEEQEGTTISSNLSIVFVRGKGFFVAFDGGKYYKVFPDSDNYNTTLDVVTKARQDRLFFIQSLDENRYYHYDGVDLRLLTTSEPEIAGRVWNEDNATPKAESYYGSVKALRDLPKRLGLGRYLVTDDRKRKKLDPNDSTKYLDGSPAKLDGSEGQCMWCWNGFYANIWHDGSRLIKAVTFDKPVGGETSVWIPAGGISWLGAGVMDRTNNILCSVINDSPQFRGGAGVALDPSKYSKAPAADSPQITMLGMPATVTSLTNFGNYARKRGEGWEANWFVARFVVEFLFEVIMGTENSQAAFNAEKDAKGLYQGGFGTGVTDMPDWGGYNGNYPVIPTSVGLEAGDGVCLVPYSLPQTDGAEGEAYKTFNVPVFFGLVGAGFGHLLQWVRGLIMDAGEEKSLVYVSTSMYADYYPDTVADKIMVAECPRVSGWIMRKSYKGLCCMPTAIGGSPTLRYSDQFYTNAGTSNGLRVRAAGGTVNGGANAGASYTNTYSAAPDAAAHCSVPLCYFEEDPVIPESEKLIQE